MDYSNNSTLQLLQDEIQARQLVKFGRPSALILWPFILVSLFVGIMTAVLLQPVAVPICYTTDEWEWKNLQCLNESNFNRSQLTLEDSGQCSCLLEEGYRYYIGGPSNALECGLSLCIYLERSSEEGYLFQSCSWDEGGDNITTINSGKLENGAGIYLDQLNARKLCSGI